MNSDPLGELWRQQPLPAARAYREISERSHQMRRKADRYDGLGSPSLNWVYGFWILMGLISPSWVYSPLAVLGTGILGWKLWARRQRRRAIALLGASLIGEVDGAILRLRQNQRFNFWMGCISTPVALAQGCWVFRPRSVLGHPLVLGDWLWSGLFVAFWFGIMAVLLRVAWNQWKERAAVMRELTALRDELVALNLPDAER